MRGERMNKAQNMVLVGWLTAMLIAALVLALR